jgi:hypothetical protein
VFERFTDRARRVVVLAQEEARLLNHNYIGTEHILLGLIREGESVASKTLEALDISLAAVRNQVEEIIGQGGSSPSGHIPFTPRAKKVLELSLREALQLGHNYIGTEHILLGLIREGEGVAAHVLVKLGADLSRVRPQVIQLLSGHVREKGGSTGGGMEPGVEALGDLAMQARSAGFAAGAAIATACSFCGRDVWELDHYVTSSRATMCPECVAAAQGALDQAASAGETAGAVHLPPRVFGAAPTDPAAITSIQQAFTTAFSGEASDDAREAVLEDGAELRPVLAEARERGPRIGSVRVQVERMRFVDDRRARVRFAILLDHGGPSFDGEAMEQDGRWLVSRDTFCRVVAMIGVRCPPRSDEAK